MSAYRPAFVKDTALSFATHVAVFVFSFLTSTIIARTLGPAGSGTISLLITIATMSGTIIGMGINSSLVYFTNSRKYPEGDVVGSTLAYSLAAGALTAAGLTAAAFPISRGLLNGAPPSLLVLSAWMIPVLLLTENIGYVFLAHRDIPKQFYSVMVRSVVYLSLLSFLWLGNALSVGTVLVGFAVSQIATLGTAWLLKPRAPLALKRDVLFESLRFGVKRHAGAVAQLLNYRLDAFLIAAFLTNTEVGLYSLAVMMAETIFYIPNAVGQILFSKTAASDASSANVFTPLACRNTLLISLISSLALALASRVLVPLVFTDKFIPSITALHWLLPGIVAMSVSKVLMNDLVGRGEPLYVTYASVISLALNVGLNLALIPRLGIIGASLSSTLSYTASALVMIHFFKKVTGSPLWELIIPKRVDFICYRNIVLRKPLPPLC